MAFIKFRDKLRSLATGITGDSTEADDLLHDAFCKLWINHQDIKDETEAFKLAYTVVRNSAIDSVRRTRSHPSLSLDRIPATYTSVEDSDREDRVAVCNALITCSRRILNDNQYHIFYMHDIEGIAYPDIAREMGLSQENVRMILSRARKTIRDYYRNK